MPRLKTEQGFKNISWQEAAELVATKLKESNSKRFEISPHVALEEMLMLKKAADSYQLPLYANPEFARFSDNLLCLQPVEEPYGILDKFSEYVVCGELNQTLATMLRLKQRKGKKLILVNYPEGTFAKFADQVAARLSEVQASDKTLFIYNQNRISELEAFEIWKLASEKGKDNILLSTDYRNHLGLLAMQPKMGTCSACDFAIAYGAYPQKAKAAKFSVAIVNFMDENAPVDLLLPAAGYLELEATALADLGHLTKSRNPADSPTINELMRLFYTLGWINPNTAETPFWNAEADKLIQSLKHHQPKAFASAAIDPDHLNPHPAKTPTPLEQRIQTLFESRTTVKGF